MILQIALRKGGWPKYIKGLCQKSGVKYEVVIPFCPLCLN